jgi:hypothetical protein
MERELERAQALWDKYGRLLEGDIGRCLEDMERAVARRRTQLEAALGPDYSVEATREGGTYRLAQKRSPAFDTATGRKVAEPHG